MKKMLKLVYCVGALLLMSGTAMAVTITVPINATSIQDAVNKAASGDVILVRPGIYFENITIINKSVSIKSTHGAVRTIIDGSNQGTVINMQITTDSTTGSYPCTVEGVTIQNGTGGIHATSLGYGAKLTVNIINSVLTRNAGGVAVFGEGMPGYGSRVDILINSSSFTHNTGGLYGGAVRGGMLTYIQSVDSIFANNEAVVGGAIYMGSYSDLAVERSIFSGNKAQQGGAISGTSGSFGSFNVTSSVFDMNSAAVSGGAFYLELWMPSMFLDNTITRNTAPEGASISHTGSAGAISGRNNIIYGNSTLPYFQNPNLVSFTYSDIEGGLIGEGNIAVDPLFVDALARNYQLSQGSPAINTALNGNSTDIFEVQRPLGGAFDMGAYEYFVNSAPVSTAVISGTLGQNGNYTSAVTATITAQDDGGVKEIHYLVNGVETVVAGSTASIELASDGVYTISYFAVDNAGLAEVAQPLTVTIDKTSPSVISTIPAINATGILTTASIVITFSENIVQGSAISNITVSSDSSTVDTTKTVSGKELIINLSSALRKNSAYMVTIPVGAVADVTGNNNAAYNLVFTTGTK